MNRIRMERDYPAIASGTHGVRLAFRVLSNPNLYES
jgi:hypothetical protein